MCTATTAEDETDIKPLMSLSLAGAAGNHANPSRERERSPKTRGPVFVCVGARRDILKY